MYISQNQRLHNERKRPTTNNTILEDLSVGSSYEVIYCTAQKHLIKIPTYFTEICIEDLTTENCLIQMLHCWLCSLIELQFLIPHLSLNGQYFCNELVTAKKGKKIVYLWTLVRKVKAKKMVNEMESISTIGFY